MPARPLRRLEPAFIAVGFALAIFVGCSNDSASTAGVTHPTMIEIAPEQFRGAVPCAANGSEAGQLDVYRAFVRVPPQLLQRNGITTLRFEDDRLVSDPDLQQAILTSVQHVLGRPCPPDVFVHG